MTAILNWTVFSILLYLAIKDQSNIYAFVAGLYLVASVKSTVDLTKSKD